MFQIKTGSQEHERTGNTTRLLLKGLVLCGYLEKAMSVGQVTVEMAALVQLL